MKRITYLNECIKNDRLVRWSDSSMPLKFYIAPFRWYKGQGEEYKYKQMVIDALKAWEKACEGKVKFNIVPALHDSHINLDWKRVDRKSLGYCTFNFDSIGRLYSAEVQIGLSDGILHADYMNEKEVYHTILHEIGHAIGLLNHSPNSRDIMYTPHQYGTIALSKSDIETAKWLYRLPHGKTAKEAALLHNISAQNFDELVFKLVHKNDQAVQAKTQSATPQKDLLDETTEIAEIKKYQLLLQNINLSDLGKQPDK